MHRGLLFRYMLMRGAAAFDGGLPLPNDDGPPRRVSVAVRNQVAPLGFTWGDIGLRLVIGGNR